MISKWNPNHTSTFSQSFSFSNNKIKKVQTPTCRAGQAFDFIQSLLQVGGRHLKKTLNKVESLSSSTDGYLDFLYFIIAENEMYMMSDLKTNVNFLLGLGYRRKNVSILSRYFLAVSIFSNDISANFKYLSSWWMLQLKASKTCLHRDRNKI